MAPMPSITRAGTLARPGIKPVCVKVAKPQQDLRLDMPTFGLNTLKSLKKAGFAGRFWRWAKPWP